MKRTLPLPALVALAAGVGCVEPEPEPNEAVVLGDEVPCASPVDVWSELRPREVGLDVPFDDPELAGRFPAYEAPVAVIDVDGDGDLDVLAHRWDRAPTLYVHAGGTFTAQPAAAPLLDEVLQISTFAVVDLDDDGLPELLLAGPGFVLRMAGLGADAGYFGPPEDLWRSAPEERMPNITALAWGDVDRDGDLDLAAATAFALPPGATWPPDDPDQVLPAADDLLLRNDGGTFILDRALRPADDPALAQLVAFTDRDGDGDLDLLLATDQGRRREPTAFFRNDGNDDMGRPLLINDAPAVEADLRLSAMGLAVADLDADGHLDYCMTDIGPVRCLLSAGGGPYVDGGLALGLNATTAEREDRWSGWSLEIEDLDNDGRLDAVAAGGDPGDEGGFDGDPALFDHPDTLWRGDGDGFEDVTDAVGFGSLGDHYGLVTADVDQDGALDVVVFGTEGTPTLWSAGCTAGSWLHVELQGPPGNREGWGTRVEATVDGWTTIREVHGQRTQGQGPPVVHLGLGEAESVDLRVVWTDGEVTEIEDIPGRRTVTVVHSSRR